MFIAEGIGTVKKHQVPVPFQFPILETVIHEKNIRFQLLRLFHRPQPVFPHQYRYMRQFQGHHIRLIPCHGLGNEDMCPVRNKAALFFKAAPVAPADNGRMEAFLFQHVRHFDDTGCLPCAAGSHIAYGNDRNPAVFCCFFFRLPALHHLGQVQLFQLVQKREHEPPFQVRRRILHQAGDVIFKTHAFSLSLIPYSFTSSSKEAIFLSVAP